MMGLDITTMGENAIGGAVGGIMDLAFGGIKNKRALKQDRKIGEQQMARERQMTEFGNQASLDKLTKTPEAMRKAGLNVGLMYGTGGAGAGQSTTASEGTHAQTDMSSTSQGMGMQLGLQKAQIDNLNANTEKAKVEAAKTAGADTENVGMDTKKKEQEIQNLMETANLTREQATKVVLEQQKTNAETTNINADTTVKREQRENIQVDTEKKKAETEKITQETLAQITKNVWLNEKEKQEVAKITNDVAYKATEMQQNRDKISVEQQKSQWEVMKIGIERDLRSRGLDIEETKMILNSLSQLMGGVIMAEKKGTVINNW